MAIDEVEALGDACNDARLLEAEQLLAQGSFNVLSLDVFDTLVWRTVPEPVDAFVLFGRHLLDRGELRGHTAPELFARLRERAEIRARRKVSDAGKVPEVRLEGIYREMSAHLFSVPLAALPEREVAFERAITFPDLEVVRLAHTAQAKLGVRLVLVSDTYFSAAEIRRMLDREPFDELRIDDVFTSSQYGVGKGSGLYRVVLEQLGVDPSEVLHIGDNADADLECARREGIRTVHFDKQPGSLGKVLEAEGLLRTDHRQRQKPTLDPEHGDWGLTALRAKAVSQLEGAEAPMNPYWRFGASVLGPVFAGFAEWVHERAQEEGVEVVWCLMREGEFLSRLLNGARGYLRSPVRAETLWLSRQVCSRAAIFEASLSELETFLDREVRPTVGQLCDTLGVSLSQLPDLQGDADSRLDDPELAARTLRRMAEQPQVRASILAGAASLRGRLVDYVVKTLGPDTARAVVVDLGWGCTIQVNLDAALASSGSSLSTLGLYLLTNEGALERTLDGVESDGFLASAGFPDHASWITRSPEILEQVCMHDEGTLVDFTDDAEPLLRPTPQSPTQMLQRSAVQRGILAFQREWGRYRPTLPPAARRLGDRARAQLARMVTRFVVSPTTEEVALFGDWVHDQNFGSAGAATVVQESMAAAMQYLTPRQLLELPMHRVYWPFAMAAMHNPQLALATGAVFDRTLPVEAFEATQPCSVRVFVDAGGGFDEAVRKPAGPNVNGLCFVRAEVTAASVRGVMLRFSDEPGVLRLDRLTLSFSVRGRSAPHVVDVAVPEGFDQLQFRNGVLLADNVLLASRAAPEVVYRCPPDLALAAYRVEVEAAFAWMTTPRLRGRRAGNVETVVQLARKVTGKARNVWLSSGQEASERFRPRE
ncbi:MAG TPA: HAD family hydrolase [Acidimicrobiales bacterium]|nr:HAD family hydrolase [Acidimicrobiales bacterium]